MDDGVSRVEPSVRRSASSARLAWLSIATGFGLLAVFCVGPEWVQTVVSVVVMVLGMVALVEGYHELEEHRYCLISMARGMD